MDIVIIGEAYGAEEEKAGKPFVGATGYELNKLLREANISRQDCHITNVFNLRPGANKIENLCGPKALGIAGYPSIGKSLYIDRRYEAELTRLAREIKEEQPNIIIALGNTACWAMLGTTGIMKIRGTTLLSSHTVSGIKVLPTYHPAAIFRDYTLRPIVVVDLIKAARESEFPEIRRPKREIWIEPSLSDMETFYAKYIKECRCLAIDIETAGSQVTCIGFAPEANRCLVIPFHDQRKRTRSYWPTLEDELEAWRFVRGICEGPIPKTFQNGLYDIAFLYRSVGIAVANAQHDTMLLHHALQPESLKGLGFLGSVYTDEGNWKQMRVKTTIKRDD